MLPRSFQARLVAKCPSTIPDSSLDPCGQINALGLKRQARTSPHSLRLDRQRAAYALSTAVLA